MAAAGDNDGNGADNTAGTATPNETKPPQLTAKVLNQGEALDEVFVDGTFNLQVNDSVAKFEFYNIAAIDSTSNEQSWRRTQRLVMPLNAVPRLMSMLQQMMADLQKSGRMRVAPQNQEAGKTNETGNN